MITIAISWIIGSIVYIAAVVGLVGLNWFLFDIMTTISDPEDKTEVGVSLGLLFGTGVVVFAAYVMRDFVMVTFI